MSSGRSRSTTRWRTSIASGWRRSERARCSRAWRDMPPAPGGRERPSPARNPCAGRLGAAYDYYIERERLARVIGHVVWGIDTSKLYASIRAVVGARDHGETILDVP